MKRDGGRFSRLLLGTLLGLPLIACGPPPPASKPLQAPPPPALSMTLGPEDVIDVQVYGEHDLSGLFQVATDGSIVFPMLGKVQAGGKTPANVVTEIEQGLAQGFIKNPQVTVLVKESNSRRIVIYGEVQKPSQLPYTNDMSIAQAVSQAGGFTQMAAMDSVVVTRLHDQKQEAFRVDVKAIAQGRAANYYLMPGDQVFVPQRTF